MDPINMNQMPPMPQVPQKKSSGPLIAVIIILVLIVIGGMYFLGQRMNKDYGVPSQTDQITDSLNQQSSSDDLNSIEADLNAVDFDSLDQGAAVIEAEL
ncbi:MAG: hypothetical protein AAB863_00810 [Patescibacteria group bacterium]